MEMFQAECTVRNLSFCGYAGKSETESERKNESENYWSWSIDWFCKIIATIEAITINMIR